MNKNKDYLETDDFLLAAIDELIRLTELKKKGALENDNSRS